MTRHLNPKDVRRETDSLLDEVEMAFDDYGLLIIRAALAWGYSDAIAWAAAAAARDGALCIIEAEENRRARLAANEASQRLREGR